MKGLAKENDLNYKGK